jgi:hypothetical protein
VEIRVAAVRPRQIDLDHVEGALRDELGALGIVDHVVRRRHDRIERPDRPRVVAEGAEGLDVGHAGAHYPGSLGEVRAAMLRVWTACLRASWT